MDPRPRGVTATVRATLAALACGLVTACAGTTGVGSSSDDDRCVSHYLHVAGAATWPGLTRAMLLNRRWETWQRCGLKREESMLVPGALACGVSASTDVSRTRRVVPICGRWAQVR